MNKVIGGLMLCGVIINTAGCKTTGAKGQSSEKGALAGRVVNSMMPGDTPEEVVVAIQSRLDNLNLYTSGGELATQSNCPSSPKDPCGMVNIFIEFETPGSRSVGHTGVSVASPLIEEGVQIHQYYDFGPGKDTIEVKSADGKVETKKIKVGDPGVYSLPRAGGNLFTGMKGTQWWDNPQLFSSKTTPSEITASDIVEKIDDIAGDYTVIRVPICVSKAHQELINRYWVKTYLNMPNYRIPGNHCTSMVAQSFETTIGAAQRLQAPSTLSWSVDTLDRYVTSPRDISQWITSPTMYADRVLKNGVKYGVDYRHQCGKLKGSMPQAVVVHTESLFQDEKLEPYVKWKTDSKFP